MDSSRSYSNWYRESTTRAPGLVVTKVFASLYNTPNPKDLDTSSKEWAHWTQY